MPITGAANLIGGLIFGAIGFVAFFYGKRMHIWTPMLIGIALMVFPYFIEQPILLYTIGILGTAALFLFRD